MNGEGKLRGQPEMEMAIKPVYIYVYVQLLANHKCSSLCLAVPHCLEMEERMNDEL